MNPRVLIKDAVRGVVAALAPPMWRLSRQPRLLILMYHRVMPRDDATRQFEQPGMIVAPETFEMHLRVLRRHFELMRLGDWVQTARSGAPLPQRACAITFDDGWRDNYTWAFPVLRSAGAPATIFLVSRLIGQSYGFWPTRLARVLHAAWAAGDTTIPARLTQRCPAVQVPVSVSQNQAGAVSDAVLVELKQAYGDEAMLRTTAEIESLAGTSSERELMSWDEVQEMRASGLVEFGSHTCTHARMRPDLELKKATWEINQSAEDLQQQLGARPAGFCYPNGDHTPAAIELVRNRYDYAVTTRHGWNNPQTDPMLLRRIGVHDDVSDTPARFLARLAAGL